MVPAYQKPRMKSAPRGIGRVADPRKSSRKPRYCWAPATIVEATVRANNRTCSHTRSWNFGAGCQTTTGVGSKLADVLEVFARLETDRAARRDPDFLPGAGVAADAALARLHLEHAEPAKLDALPPLHRASHPLKN